MEHFNNRGGLMLVDAYRNCVLEGVNFDLDVESAERWIDHYKAA